MNKHTETKIYDTQIKCRNENTIGIVIGLFHNWIWISWLGVRNCGMQLQLFFPKKWRFDQKSQFIWHPLSSWSSFAVPPSSHFNIMEPLENSEHCGTIGTKSSRNSCFVLLKCLFIFDWENSTWKIVYKNFPDQTSHVLGDLRIASGPNGTATLFTSMPAPYVSNTIAFWDQVCSHRKISTF